jgi:hypothetical protein
MKQILFPLKTNPSTNTEMKWEAMDPLSFAEYITRHLKESAETRNLPNNNTATTTTTTTTTTNNTTLAQRRGKPPLQINTDFLSLDLTMPNVPPSPPHSPNTVGTFPPNLVSKVLKDYHQESPEPILLLPTDMDMNMENHNHRKRPISKIFLPTIVPNDEDLEEDQGEGTPWNPNFLILHNPHDTATAQHITKELQDLTQHLESMPHYRDCISSYKRFQLELFRNSKELFHSQQSVQDKTTKFNQLYSDALLHVKALISMAQNLQHYPTKASLVTKSHPHDNDDTAGQNNHLHLSKQTTTDDDAPKDHLHRTTPKTYNKKDFTQVMNQWLVDNWTNPYPDDEGIASLAEINGTTPTIVSNWLINARTRKWRPAIVKAYEAGRPADLLKEDSIRIFQRKPLRKL